MPFDGDMAGCASTIEVGPKTRRAKGGGAPLEGTGSLRGPRPRTRLEAVPVGDHRLRHHLSDGHDRRSRHDHPHLAHHPLRPLADLVLGPTGTMRPSRLSRSRSATSSRTAGAGSLRSAPA